MGTPIKDRGIANFYGEKEPTPGKTAIYMKEISAWIKKKGKEH
jgi:hypothetical protein